MLTQRKSSNERDNVKDTRGQNGRVRMSPRHREEAMSGAEMRKSKSAEHHGVEYREDLMAEAKSQTDHTKPTYYVICCYS